MILTALYQLTAYRQPRVIFSNNRQKGDEVVQFDHFSFCSIRIGGVTYNHDVVIDRDKVRKRKTFGHLRQM